MDIGNIGSKATSFVTSNAMELSVIGSVLARQLEVYPGDIGAAINGLVDYATRMDSNGMLAEVNKTISDPTYLIYKLFQSNHLYSALVKLGIAGYVVSEIGIIGAKWKTASKKMALGGALAAVISQGSGPQKNSTQTNFANAPMMSALTY